MVYGRGHSSHFALVHTLPTNTSAVISLAALSDIVTSLPLEFWNRSDQIPTLGSRSTDATSSISTDLMSDSQRDAVLAVACRAASRFVRNHNWEVVLEEALEELAIAIRADRSFFSYMRKEEDDDWYLYSKVEWVADGVEAQIDRPEFKRFAVRGSGFDEYLEPSLNGLSFHRKVRDLRLPARELMQSHGVVSFIILPVCVHGTLFGVIGFEDCRTEREWATAVIEALQSAADTLAGSIERNLEEQRRRTVEEQFRQFAAIAPLAMWMADVDGNVTFLQNSAARFFGRPINDSEADTWPDFIHPDDRAQRHNTIEQAAARSIEYQIEYRICRPDGEYRTVYEQAVPRYDSAGQFAGFFGTMLDITDRKRAEAEVARQRRELQSLLDAVQAQVIYIDREARVIRHNLASQKFSGMTDEQIRGGTIEKNAPFWDDPKLRHEQSLEVIRTGKPRLGSVEWYKLGDEKLWVLADKVPMTDDDGQICGAMLFIYDITERVRAEEQLRQQESQLAHVGRLTTMGEMAAGIAHEITQPLASISNFAAACQTILKKLDGDAPTKAVRWVQKIEAEALRTHRIINRLRGFARNTQPHRSTCDLNELVRESEALIEFDARKSRVVIEHELSESIPLVQGDRIQLQQVLVNLLRNSCEALHERPADERRIRVATRSIEDSVELVVSDSGPGIRREDLPRVFDPFFTTKTDGMGIGLAVSRKIVEAHGGQISVENSAANGCCFHVKLPIQASEK